MKASALTLLSGAVMMAAGYVGATVCWIAAGLITIPGALLIGAALALVGRGDPPYPWAQARGRRFHGQSFHG